MHVQPDRERLAANFVELCETDSPSRREGGVASLLRRKFTTLGADEIIEDASAPRTGADCGNLLVRFRGTSPSAPLYFNCHMDTVQPGEGVRVRRDGDVFSSRGETVLGGDDKSGIAILLEAISCLRAVGIPHAPVEFLFTTCEEIGLLGAKAFDPALLRARMGYALDSSGRDRLIIGAPAANRYRATVAGVAAHAGLCPEKGVSAIQIAAVAVAGLALGRLDADSTANVGIISGGSATNIVPDEAVVQGEIRSHDAGLLARHTEAAREAFSAAVGAWRDPGGQAAGRPSLVFDVSRDYPVMRLRTEDEVVRRACRAAFSLGAVLDCVVAGGGSDANIFNGRGIATGILATGMSGVHSTDESIDLADMVATTALVMAILAQ